MNTGIGDLVLERVVGVRKAVGARRREILEQFLLEALIISESGHSWEAQRRWPLRRWGRCSCRPN